MTGDKVACVHPRSRSALFFVCVDLSFRLGQFPQLKEALDLKYSGEEFDEIIVSVLGYV